MDNGEETEEDGRWRGDGRRWTAARRQKTMDGGEEIKDDGWRRKTMDGGEETMDDRRRRGESRTAIKYGQ